MLREMYIGRVARKEQPNKIETFNVTNKVYEELKWKHGYFMEWQRFEIYGVPNEHRLTKLSDIENYFNISFKKLWKYR